MIFLIKLMTGFVEVVFLYDLLQRRVELVSDPIAH